MNWNNLQNNKCPQCERLMTKKDNQDYSCLKCGFFCRKSRGGEIMDSLSDKQRDKGADEFLKVHGCFISTR